MQKRTLGRSGLKVSTLGLDDWDRMIDVNIKGVLYGIAAALRRMKLQKMGHIINVSSVAGHKVSPEEGAKWFPCHETRDSHGCAASTTIYRELNLLHPEP